ncbi:MAG: hypothetical protein ACUVWR_11235 [Anaerolineae bacterium]
MEKDRAVRCSCGSGGVFADLPPELRPRPQKRSSLREVTCPSCGKVYWTNRETDLCFDCEKKRQANPIVQG